MFDLKRFRKDKKLRQQDIATVLGIGQSFISQVEKGIDTMPDEWIDVLKNNYQIEDIEQYIIEDSLSDNPSAMEKRIIEMFLNGDLVKSSAVKEKDELINKLYKQIGLLESDLKRLGGASQNEQQGGNTALEPSG